MNSIIINIKYAIISAYLSIKMYYYNIIRFLFPYKSFKIIYNDLYVNLTIPFIFFYYISLFPFFDYIYIHILSLFDIKGTYMEVIDSYNNHIVINNYRHNNYNAFYNTIFYLKYYNTSSTLSSIILMDVKLIQNSKEYDIKNIIYKYITEAANTNFKNIYYFNHKYFKSIKFDINKPFELKYKMLKKNVTLEDDNYKCIDCIKMDKKKLKTNILTLFNQ